MLSAAFVETADFHALVETRDFNFVVGRRGTGKSALFQRVTTHFSKSKGYLCLFERPQEFQSLQMQTALARVGASYPQMRAASRIAWKAHLLYWVLGELVDHYKISGTDIAVGLGRHMERIGSLMRDTSAGRASKILLAALSDDPSPGAVPAIIAERYQISRLQEDVAAGLGEINKTALVYYDGLDEGWTPSLEGTAVLGGLSAAVSDLDEAETGIHGTLFVRDNMFRALAHLDQDYSRHIEGNALRLHWDEGALFQLVAARLRVALGVDSENPEKVWNELADEDIRDRQGFEKCLKLTLYRPRDILVLINRAYVGVQRAGDTRLSQRAIDAAATDISNDRLDDLIKEYDRVLPGVRSFVKLFETAPAFDTMESVISRLDTEIGFGAYEDEADSDFAALGSGKQVLHALYGIGFLGFEDTSRDKVVFCHDGSGAEVQNFTPSHRMVVHPCYWKALELATDAAFTDVVVEINDEFDASKKDEVSDSRVRRLGQVVSELPKVVVGAEGAGDFEEWVLRAVRLLFAGKLSNPELHPCPDGIQRRDVVATNIAESGLWQRIHADWGSRQVVFEVKNYEDLKMEDFRQVLSYTTGEYGRFGVIVHRGKSEAVSEKLRGWLQVLYHEHQRVILTVPAAVLSRAISKLRNADRLDYIEDQLSKRLDTFVRSYLSLKHQRSYRGRRKRRKKK
ncbi:MAG: hypothetical protein Q8P50_00955 [Bacillota bacterium]|nr:hypothetical protein [Bacillota bacterium]